MVKPKSDLPAEERELLNWGFNLNGRVPLNWGIVAQSLARGAEILHERGLAARQLRAKLWGRDSSGLPVVKRPRPLTPEEQGLLPDVEMHRVAFMLLSMAIENLTKGILIGRNPGWVRDGELSNVPTNHDLETLVQQCGVSVNGEDAVALRVLTEHGVWLGRYPIPKSADRITRLTTKQKLRAQTDEYLDYVFAFGERLINDLAVLLDAEHDAENAAARIALAETEAGEKPPRDPFNLTTLRTCPWCSGHVVIPVMNAESTARTSGAVTTLDAPRHEPPVCQDWMRAEQEDAYGLALHMLAGRPSVPN